MDSATLTRRRGGVEILKSRLLGGVEGLTHGFTGRAGGVGRESYGALNLSHGVGEDRGVVVENRRFAAAALGFPFGAMTLARQVHGNRIALVQDQDRGRGRLDPEDAMPDADGLMTRISGIALGVQTADCAPILIADPVRKVCAAVHAGWRGLALRVVEAAVAALSESFESSPSELLAAIGPAIGPCCYEVGPDLIEKVDKGVPSLKNRLRVGPSGRGFFDVPGAAKDQLLRAGVPESSVEDLGLCTAGAVGRVYSRRVEGPESGRGMAVILWK